MIEGATTQSRIRESAGLPKSTVSEQVSLAVEQGILSGKGLRTKVYGPATCLAELLMAHHRRSTVYAASIRRRVAEFKQMVNSDDDSRKLVHLLEDFERAYAILEEFTSKMWSTVAEVP
jgi:hypothetical protein